MLNSSKLKSSLLNMDLYSTEPPAVQELATAFDSYFAEATSGGVAIIPAALVGCKTAMATALAGMSATGLGATKLQAGIVAYWGKLATPDVAGVAWPTATAVVPPPGLSTLATALEAVFAANVAGSLSKSDAMGAIADTIHGLQTGGICNWPVPPAGIGPQSIL